MAHSSWFAFILACLSTSLCFASLQAEREALLMIKQAAMGGHAEPGNASTLTALNISGLNLSGTLSPAVGRLPNQVSFSLACTQFSGTLPSQLSHLGRLQYLNISNNAFVGSFPGNFSRLVFLEVLDASGNNFTGELPADVVVLGRLRHLHLGANFFVGTIPLSYGNLLNAEYLNVGDNNLTGHIPITFGRLSQLRHLYLGYNALVGAIPAELVLLKNLLVLDFQSCKLSGAIPSALSSLSNLDTLFLQNNNLQGPIPPQIGNLSGLKSLDLSSNSISGIIPNSLCNVTNLQLLSLLYNFMDGVIPACIGNLSKLQGMPRQEGPSNIEAPFKVMLICCIGLKKLISFCLPTLALKLLEMVHKSLDESVTGSPARILHIAGVGVGVACILSLLVWIVWHRYIMLDKYHMVKKSFIFKCLRKVWSAMAQWTFVKFEKLHFTLQNILQSLEDDNIIGQGGSGTVYRGVMPCGRVLAIRRIPASGESWKELDILGKVGHRHIIKLLGWCSNGHTHLLLYDYMPNGSLGQLIYGGPAALVHDAWETRFNIALGAAEGLAYLHHDCFPPILHRDVKPNNILIDSRCQAKLADFGFARPLLQGPTTPRSFSSIAGTCGYLAPEYGHTLRVDDKSDVYSYGVVLLELVTGQKPLSAEFGEGMDIVKWARSMALTEENFLHMLDSILGDS
ncbi:hypothetical protein L7F22_008700 [Adiantum nelumboides]|nr:hypothetical protein [Adiantum nelumboides]